MRLVGLIVGISGLLSADSRCLPCHPRQTASFAKTGMGRSITLPSAEAAATPTIRHALSGTALHAEWRSTKLHHSITRGGQSSAYPIAWAVGSGNQGKSYLIAIGDALFQSPLSWYSARKAWDLSPGYQDDREPDFYRPVTADCLFCHAGAARPRPGTLNRYFDPPFAPASIDCQRCHGDPAAHLQSRKRSDIINPSRLDPDRRDAVCEQCHLSGAARIPNAGKNFADYRPGMRMEDVFSVYVEQGSKDARGLKVVSHSEQMVRSRCYLESSGAMWCGTCHDPHQEPANKIDWYRDKCLQCHQSKSAAAHRKKAGDDCSSCHMPQTRPYDGGHTAFHDHWIRLKDTPASSAAAGLRAWREPSEAMRSRNLGLAYISTGDVQRGFPLLTPDPSDGASETARGLALLRANRYTEALAAFRHAVEEQPGDSTRQLNLAAAFLTTGNRTEARQRAEKAIALEPLLEDAYVLLAEIEPQRASYWKQRYQQLVPQRRLP